MEICVGHSAGARSSVAQVHGRSFFYLVQCWVSHTGTSNYCSTVPPDEEDDLGYYPSQSNIIAHVNNSTLRPVLRPRSLPGQTPLPLPPRAGRKLLPTPLLPGAGSAVREKSPVAGGGSIRTQFVGS